MIEEACVSDSGVHQMHVGSQREAGIGVPRPLGHLLHVAPLLEQERSAGVPELWKVTQISPTASLAGCSTSVPRFGGDSGPPVAEQKIGVFSPI